MGLKEELQIIITGKDKGASKAIGGLDKKLASLGKVAGVAGGAIVAGLALAGVALGKLAIDATDIPGVQKAFEGLTAEFEGGADAMLDAMQKQSYGMISNMDLMKQFNLSNQLVGEDFSKKLPDAMGYLSKVASATGEDMGYMMDSLVRGVGRMSPMILDNLGIQVSLSEAYDVYAEKIGSSVDALSKAEQQTALMDQVMMKLAENTEKMPDVLGTADQQWKSLTTTFTNLKDDIGVKLLPALQTLMTIFQALWAEHGPALMDLFETKLVPAIERIAGIIGMFAEGMDAEEILTNIFPPEVADFLLDKLIPAVQSVIDYLKEKLPVAIQNVVDYMTAVFGPTLEMIFGYFKSEGPGAIQKLMSWFQDKLLPTLERIWEFIYVDMMPVWEAFGELLAVTIGTAFTILAGIWQNVLQPALQAIWGWIQDKILPIFEAWFDKMGGIAGIIEKVTKKIKELTDKLKNIKLPDWMTPGSPTPWEVGLMGVVDAMDQLSSKSMPNLGTGLGNLPGNQLGTGKYPSGQSFTGSPVAVLQYNPEISLASREEAERIMLPMMLKAIREAQRNG